MIKRSIEDTSIVFIGAGNLATNLAHAFYRKGFRVVQIYSRTEESARTLAQAVEADYTTSLASVVPDAQLYIVSLKDDALVELLPQIVAGKGKGLWVHTAGSIPMDIWKGHVERYGVFYPLQTFSKSRLVDFHEIPVFVEGSSDEEVHFLKQIASALSRKVLEANSEQRRNAQSSFGSCFHLQLHQPHVCIGRTSAAEARLAFRCHAAPHRRDGTQGARAFSSIGADGSCCSL